MPSTVKLIPQQIMQISAKLNPALNGSSLPQARAILLDWLEAKTKIKISEAGRNGESFILDEGNYSPAEVVANDQIWTLRFEHPDQIGRLWRTEAVLGKIGDEKLFGAKLVCLRQENSEPPSLSMPGFIPMLADTVGLEDAGVDLIREPNVIASEDGAEALYDFIADRGRTMPVVVVSERKQRVAPPPAHAIVAVEPLELASRLYGLAHVFYLPEETSWRFSDLMTKEWAVYNGSARYYRPGFNADEDSYHKHPIAFFETIQRWGNGKGASAFIGHLMRQAYTDSVSALDAETKVPSFTKIKNWILAQRTEEHAHSTGEVQSADLMARIGGLEQEVKDVWGVALEQEQKVKQLQDELTGVTADRDNLLALVTKLRADNEKLAKRKEWQVAATENTYPIPRTLDDLNEWVEQYFPDRLQLTRRALSSARKSVYHDVPRIYQSLILIATGYHDMVFGNSAQARQSYEQRSQELKVEISKTFAGEKPTVRAESYYVPWDDGKRLLDRHLQHGNSHDPRYCLRMYFFADEARKRIVIGHMPDHLPNAFT